MVLPGEELPVKIKHIGMRQGNPVVKVETYNDRDAKVLEGTSEVAQPPTAYVFTGQGSQEPGLGMELYNNSPFARAVWDFADLAVYGFSIVEIVKDNPKEKTINFGGIKGQATRSRYMEMTYDTMDKDDVVRTLPLFGDIDAHTQRYTFSHPNGLPFAAQFAQIVLVVTEKAAFEDMQSKGFIQKNAVFGGHSLGEYSAFASVAGVLPISSLVDVVIHRGIATQRAVERDSTNRSNYAMCAVNPSRISLTFNDSALRQVVDDISRKINCLLEIVNFNVDVCQFFFFAQEIISHRAAGFRVNKPNMRLETILSAVLVPSSATQSTRRRFTTSSTMKLPLRVLPNPLPPPPPHPPSSPKPPLLLLPPPPRLPPPPVSKMPRS